MKIKQLEITEEDLVEAVKDFLIKNGINVKVTSVAKEYSHRDFYTVECEVIKPETRPTPLEAIQPLLEQVEPKDRQEQHA